MMLPVAHAPSTATGEGTCVAKHGDPEHSAGAASRTAGRQGKRRRPQGQPGVGPEGAEAARR